MNHKALEDVARVEGDGAVGHPHIVDARLGGNIGRGIVYGRHAVRAVLPIYRQRHIPGRLRNHVKSRNEGHPHVVINNRHRHIGRAEEGGPTRRVGEQQREGLVARYLVILEDLHREALAQVILVER